MLIPDWLSEAPDSDSTLLLLIFYYSPSIRLRVGASISYPGPLHLCTQKYRHHQQHIHGNQDSIGMCPEPGYDYETRRPWPALPEAAEERSRHFAAAHLLEYLD
jgi:hypothetical protein